MAGFYAAMAIRQFRNGLVVPRRRPPSPRRPMAEGGSPCGMPRTKPSEVEAVKRLDVEVFSRDFAASALNLRAIAIIPIACPCCSPPSRSWILSRTSSPPLRCDHRRGHLHSRRPQHLRERRRRPPGDRRSGSWSIPPASFGKMSDLATLGLLVVSLLLSTVPPSA